MNSKLLLKIHRFSLSKTSFDDDYQLMIMPNKHRIVSLHLLNRLQFVTCITFHSINSLFHRLESLTLDRIKFHEIVSFLPNLATLTRLFSLTIGLDDVINNFNEIYRLIFCLPCLKYNKLSASKIDSHYSRLFTINERFASIEQLIIDHPLSLDQLHAILSSTPKLRRLTCQNLFQFNRNICQEIPLRMYNLTYCSIRKCCLKFDQFEVFIRKISSQLRILRFSPFIDISYLDGDRWQRLISQYMPYLHTFQLEYHDTVVSSPFIIHPYCSLISRFISSFWIEKQWFFNIETSLTCWLPVEIIFSIQPDKYVE